MNGQWTLADSVYTVLIQMKSLKYMLLSYSDYKLIQMFTYYLIQ